MTRGNGYALMETLVAVGIGALILTTLTWLQIDYFALARRAVALGKPTPSVRAAQDMARKTDRCAHPGATLVEDGGVLVTVREKEAIPLAGLSGATARIASARTANGQPRPGFSVAVLSQADATIAVVALRCDLPEVCAYDAAKGVCAGSR